MELARLLALVALVALLQTPEERAVAFLSREVPRWPDENRCFSCHNNGDAARALYDAARRGLAVPSDALRSTTDWLRRPRAWDDNRGDPRFSDLGLARIQFTAALVSATEAGFVSKTETALDEAAELVAERQRSDGSWQLDSGGSIGSPATYGTALATFSALRGLKSAATARLEPAIARAESWVRQVEVKTVLDGAAVVLALGPAADPAAIKQRERALALIAQGQAPSGGWGPYVSSSPEAFDTALVLLALVGVESLPENLAAAIDKGRAFLLERQLPDGSFLETTRPAGQQSYAQYISTSGWATLALLATRER